MSNFQSNPRDYALELVENGMTSNDYLFTACLKYMSHDDIRGMLHANELAPNECDNCECEIEEDSGLCEECQQESDIEEFLKDMDTTEYDIEALRSDIETDNFDIECENEDAYLMVYIVQRSLVNGQFTQAKKQCETYTLNYEEQLVEFWNR